MLSLIEVKCPHCGTEGQINLPPLGAIIVGPCPECHEMVVIYCGKVMALDNEIMKHGEMAARRDHLKGILRSYIEERVDRLFDSMEKNAQAVDNNEDTMIPESVEELEKKLGLAESKVDISPEEFEKFKTLELKLIDDFDYFRTIFG